MTACKHFTYKKADNNDDLQQGDILKKDDRIYQILKEVHPHYLKDDYTHFMILTQSCDLVRGRVGENCKSRYISIAAIRPLDIVIEREIAKYQKTELEIKGNVCSLKNQGRIYEFVERLLNNNEKEYFYLEKENSCNFDQPSCVFLRLMVALKADEHYEKCQKARILTLNDTFKAKLGWMLGNIYSRVGTDDWVPTHCTKADFKNKKKEIVNIMGCKWVDDKKLEEAEKKHNDEILKQDTQKIRDFIDSVKILNRKEEAIRTFLDVLSTSVNSVEELKDPKIFRILTNNTTLNSILK
ncbi:MAG: hypothetical protein C4541_06915 [Candidatus Auribacter fodinae]|jgi:hypothetical protein|uniref:Uncharacterized protein n=1 Tax=Candidatus Auribacter fodinae TaxID=2093366 RepID=A0A3A4R246_9BACT|nr:MAG: hypothetical protein C4541_06915 [Candidatus Auribacter fodinae]